MRSKNPLDTPPFSSQKFEIFFLYLVCSFIWGSTYFAITLQVDQASPFTAVFYRYVLASFILWVYIKFRKIQYSPSRQQHLLFFGIGTFLFCLNYILIYWAETLATSGLIAITFTSMIYFNILGTRFFFRQPISKSVFLGATLGAVGITLIFSNELRSLSWEGRTAQGLGLGLLAALSASCGNMLSSKASLQKIPVVISNAYGILYGTALTGIITLASGHSFQLPLNFRFLGAMFYLALFGTVIAFGCYLQLVATIGADRAVYSTVISPIFALTLAYFFEDLPLTSSVLIGGFLCLAGNTLTLRLKEKSKSSPPPKTRLTAPLR